MQPSSNSSWMLIFYSPKTGWRRSLYQNLRKPYNFGKNLYFQTHKISSIALFFTICILPPDCVGGGFPLIVHLNCVKCSLVNERKEGKRWFLTDEGEEELLSEDGTSHLQERNRHWLKIFAFFKATIIICFFLQN